MNNQEQEETGKIKHLKSMLFDTKECIDKPENERKSYGHRRSRIQGTPENRDKGSAKTCCECNMPYAREKENKKVHGKNQGCNKNVRNHL